MTADALKSASITTADTLEDSGTVILATNAGKGRGGRLVEQSDFITPTVAGLKDTSSTYKLVRLPWTVKVKAIDLYADGALDTSTGLTVDLGTYYTDSKVEGLINPALSGTAAGTDNNLLDASTGFQSSALHVDVLAAGKFTVEKRNKELWDAVGLSSNPGGFCDIVLTIEAAATSPGASGNGATFGVSVKYVE